MTIRKEHINMSKSVKEIPEKMTWKSDYTCGTQNATTKEVNQTLLFYLTVLSCSL